MAAAALLLDLIWCIVARSGHNDSVQHAATGASYLWPRPDALIDRCFCSSTTMYVQLAVYFMDHHFLNFFFIQTTFHGGD